MRKIKRRSKGHGRLFDGSFRGPGGRPTDLERAERKLTKILRLLLGPALEGDATAAMALLAILQHQQLKQALQENQRGKSEEKAVVE